MQRQQQQFGPFRAVLRQGLCALVQHLLGDQTQSQFGQRLLNHQDEIGYACVQVFRSERIRRARNQLEEFRIAFFPYMLTKIKQRLGGGCARIAA